MYALIPLQLNVNDRSFAQTRKISAIYFIKLIAQKTNGRDRSLNSGSVRVGASVDSQVRCA